MFKSRVHLSVRERASEYFLERVGHWRGLDNESASVLSDEVVQLDNPSVDLYNFIAMFRQHYGWSGGGTRTHWDYDHTIVYNDMIFDSHPDFAGRLRYAAENHRDWNAD